MQSSQIWRFFNEVQAGDFVVTREVQSRWLRYGRIGPDPSYYFEPAPIDGRRYTHRRRVEWSNERLDRTQVSVPFQNALRSMLTDQELAHVDEFLSAIDRPDLIEHKPVPVGGHTYDAYAVVLDRILELDAGEFEVLVSHLLTALGFECSEVIGGSGDGGVNVKGVLRVANLAHIDLYVQAKRYAKGKTVSSNDIRKQGSIIPVGSQGAFITTGSFGKGAPESRPSRGSCRSVLVNGRQLVDLLVEHWSAIPVELQQQLGLRPGLVLSMLKNAVSGLNSVRDHLCVLASSAILV